MLVLMEGVSHGGGCWWRVLVVVEGVSRDGGC